MEKKISTTVVLALVFVAFGAVSLLVVLSGRHPFLVEKKLRLGALLLSLGAVATGCRGIGPQVMCYETAPVNMIIIDGEDPESGTIPVERSESMVITGRIEFRETEEFSFLLKDSSAAIRSSGAVLPDDGAYDDSTELFHFELDRSLAIGWYELELYPASVDSISGDSWPLRKYTLRISD